MAIFQTQTNLFLLANAVEKDNARENPTGVRAFVLYGLVLILREGGHLLASVPTLSFQCLDPASQGLHLFRDSKWCGSDFRQPVNDEILEYLTDGPAPAGQPEGVRPHGGAAQP